MPACEADRDRFRDFYGPDPRSYVHRGGERPPEAAGRTLNCRQIVISSLQDLNSGPYSLLLAATRVEC